MGKVNCAGGMWWIDMLEIIISRGYNEQLAQWDGVQARSPKRGVRVVE